MICTHACSDLQQDEPLDSNNQEPDLSGDHAHSRIRDKFCLVFSFFKEKSRGWVHKWKNQSQLSHVSV